VTATDVELDDRYGRARATRPRRALIGVIAAVTFAIVLIAWVVWGGLLAPAAQIEAKDLGYADVTDSRVTVQYQVNVVPGTPARCALQALDEGFGIVGWKVVDIPSSPERVRTFATEVRTTMLPVTGLIYRCWLP
jgi:hypothetical protein